MRARQDRAQRVAHAAVEAARCRSRLVERHQRVDVLSSDRATERAAREVVDDLERARQLFALRLRLANEDLRAARRSAEAGDRKRSANLQRVRGLDALLAAFERRRA